MPSDPVVEREKHRLRQAAWRAKRDSDPERKRKHLERQRELRQQPAIKERVRKYRREAAKTERVKLQLRLSQRKVRLKKRGLTLESYGEMLRFQGGRCAICKTDKPSRGGGNYSFPVDHCHKTGRVRGLLCHHCNVTLGRFADDPTEIIAWAAKAAKYLCR